MPEKKPKLELELNKPVKIELISDSCLTGTSRFGEYHLYNIRKENGEELIEQAKKLEPKIMP